VAIEIVWIAGIVHRRCAVLVVDVAGKIPSHLVAFVVDAGTFRRRDDIEAVFVDILKEEARVFPAGHILIHVQRRCRAVEDRPCRWMPPGRKVVIITVDDERPVVDLTTRDPQLLRTTDCLSKAEGEETDQSHEEQDDPDDAHLLSPGPLCFWRPLAKDTAENEAWYPAGKQEAVHHPRVFWSRREIAQAANAFLMIPTSAARSVCQRSIRRSRVCRRGFSADRRTSLEDVEPRLLIRIIGLPRQEGFTTSQIRAGWSLIASTTWPLIVRLIAGCCRR